MKRVNRGIKPGKEALRLRARPRTTTSPLDQDTCTRASTRYHHVGHKRPLGAAMCGSIDIVMCMWECNMNFWGCRREG